MAWTLSHRVDLRTFSANESRQVLGITDPYHLPSVPGSVFLENDAVDLVRFNTTYVSGPYPQARDISLHVIRRTTRRRGEPSALRPVLGPLEYLSVDAVLMSAPKDEGVLLGRGKVDETSARPRHRGLAQPLIDPHVEGKVSAEAHDQFWKRCSLALIGTI